MKFIPLLFSTPMVQAEQAGRKTKTRRTKGLELINTNPDDWQFEWADYALKLPWRFTQKSTVNEKSLTDRSFNQAALKCPYGQLGDVLWVRETWAPILDINEKKPLPDAYIYKADFEDYPVDWNWRPNIFMPKAACRTFLEITNIRVERLQEITEQDAIAEGVLEKESANRGYVYMNYLTKSYGDIGADGSFETLWQSINGEDSWEANPFVWVIEFKPIEKPENFN